jgi:hypothetical protein
MASAILAALPLVLVFLFFQRQIIKSSRPPVAAGSSGADNGSGRRDSRHNPLKTPLL